VSATERTFKSAASQRTFGVEIECGNDNYGTHAMGIALAKAGIPLYNGVGHDGSGLEIRTPVLKGEKGYQALTKMMDFLNEKGCYVTREDGMHVHIGAPELREDEKACRALAETWFCNQSIIGRMVSAHRRNCIVQGTMVCAQITKSEMETWGQTQRQAIKSFGRKYKALNMSNIPIRNTVEFRLHEGCLDPRKAIAWIKFCQSLVEHAITNKEVLTCASKTAFLKKLDVPEDAIRVLRSVQTIMPPRKQKVFVK